MLAQLPSPPAAGTWNTPVELVVAGAIAADQVELLLIDMRPRLTTSPYEHLIAGLHVAQLFVSDTERPLDSSRASDVEHFVAAYPGVQDRLLPLVALLGRHHHHGNPEVGEVSHDGLWV